MKKTSLLFFSFLFVYFTSYSQKENISIIGVGDIMLGTNFPSKKYLPTNCRTLLNEVSDIIKNADISFGNLEGCFSDNAKLAKKCKDSTKCYAFRMPVEFGSCINEAGFDILSIANNHIMDFGQEGLNDTKKILEEFSIKYAGTLDVPYSIFVKDSVKYGFCAFSPNKGTVSIHDGQNAKKIINLLEKECDIIIASFHGGAEGKEHQNITRKTETYYGENRGNVYEFSHMLIDAGADIVFGHGPHVSRAIELYKNRLIAYSLGNFCTYRRFNLRGVNGFAPIIKIQVNRNGEFLTGEIIPIKQIGSGIPIKDSENNAIKKIQELTKKDFPLSDLQINNDGSINKINGK